LIKLIKWLGDPSKKGGIMMTNQQHKFLIHETDDYVGVATTPIEGGEKVVGINMKNDAQVNLVANDYIPLGHKISLVDLDSNQSVIEYGVQVGLTTTKWEKGDYVHTHNIKTARW